MSGSNDAADDRDHTVSAGSSGGQQDVNGLAREWACHHERDRSDRLFEDVVRAAEAELLTSVRAMAYRLVGPDDADAVINGVWEKLWARQKLPVQPGPAERDIGARGTCNGRSPDGQPGGFNPDCGTFAAYFYAAVRNGCLDVLRRRKVIPRPGADVTVWELLPDAGDLEDEVLARLDRLEEEIMAAIEVLELSARYRGMLCLMLDIGDIDSPGDGKACDAVRQDRQRLRRRVDELAGLTVKEREAASLVRRHHCVAVAAEAAPGLDVRGLYASATRKVFLLFGIEREDQK